MKDIACIDVIEVGLRVWVCINEIKKIKKKKWVEIKVSDWRKGVSNKKKLAYGCGLLVVFLQAKYCTRSLSSFYFLQFHPFL